jgi:hypothetical protein
VCTAAPTFSCVGGDGWVFHTGSKITHATTGASAHVLLSSDEDWCMNVLHLIIFFDKSNKRTNFADTFQAQPGWSCLKGVSKTV